MREQVDIKVQLPKYDFWKFVWTLLKVLIAVYLSYATGLDTLESILIILGIWMLSVAFYLAKIYRHSYKKHILSLYEEIDELKQQINNGQKK